MSDDSEPDLRFVVRLLRQVGSGVASLKDDMNVMSAILMRQDHTLAALLTEVRAMHSQHSRLANRVGVLEAAEPKS
jgi:hypothetical protein